MLKPCTEERERELARGWEKEKGKAAAYLGGHDLGNVLIGQLLEDGSLAGVIQTQDQQTRLLVRLWNNGSPCNQKDTRMQESDEGWLEKQNRQGFPINKNQNSRSLIGNRQHARTQSERGNSAGMQGRAGLMGPVIHICAGNGVCGNSSKFAAAEESLAIQCNATPGCRRRGRTFLLERWLGFLCIVANSNGLTAARIHERRRGEIEFSPVDVPVGANCAAVAAQRRMHEVMRWLLPSSVCEADRAIPW